MNAAAREIVAAAAFVAIGVAVSLAVALPQRVSANPDPGASYVWRGMNPSGQYCYPWSTLAGYHPCWHDDEGNPPGVIDYSAIDYSFYWPDSCAGAPVWMEYTGDFQLFKTVQYIDHCTGMVARIYEGSYNEANCRGDMHYLHIDPNDYWFNKEVPYQLIYIGDVSATQPDYCPWDAPHLHQSARVSAETPFYTNKLADPTRDDEWVHAIMWQSATADSDGDVWAGYVFRNDRELYLNTDPFDRCPDNPSDAAWPPDFDNNTQINILDLQQYNGRIGYGVGDESYVQRLDLDANGQVNIVDLQLFRGRMGQSCSN